MELELSHTELGKAEDLLNYIKRSFQEQMSRKHRVLLSMFETDLHIRKKDINNGKEIMPTKQLL